MRRGIWYAVCHEMARLSPIQAASLPVIGWLASQEDEDRRTGRTRAVAVATLIAGLRRPGLGVQLWDHFPGSRGIEIVKNEIRAIAGGMVSFGDRYLIAPKDPDAPLEAAADRADRRELFKRFLRHMISAGLDPIDAVNAADEVAREEVVKGIMEG